MRVLVTRPLAQARATAARLQELGHVPFVEPLLVIEPVTAPAPEGTFDALALTSANAVEGLAAQPWFAAVRALPAWAVGTRTADAARRAGLSTVTSVDGDGADLAARLAENLPAGSRLLDAGGADRAVDLAAALTDRGIRVETVIVYRAVAADALTPSTRAALSGRRIDAVLHYSLRSAETFLTLAEVGAIADAALRPLHGCLSPAIADRLRAAGATRIVIAAKPDETSLLAVLGEETSVRRGWVGKDGNKNPAGTDNASEPAREPDAILTDRPAEIPADLAGLEPRREPPVIEGKAIDLDPPKPDAPPPEEPKAASEPPPRASVPPVSQPAPRSGIGGQIAAGFIGAALSLAAASVLWSGGLIGGGDRDQAARLSAIEQRLRDVAARPAPAGIDPRAVETLTQKVAALETGIAGLAAINDRIARAEQALAQVPGLTERLARLEAAPPPAAGTPAPPAATDSALAEAVAALGRRMDTADTALGTRLDETAARLTALAADIAALGKPAAADPALDKRIDEIAAKVTALAADIAVPRLPADALTAPLARLSALEAVTKTLETGLADLARKPDNDSGRPAALAVAAGALSTAVSAGAPFGAELAALKALVPDAAVLAPLEAQAGTGVATLSRLTADLAAVTPKVIAALAPRPSADAGILDRIVDSAAQLVQVRPVGGGSGDEPGAVLARAAGLVATGDVAGALAEIAKLPAAGRALLADWMKRAGDRAGAEALARRIRADAIAALAAIRPAGG